MRIRGPFIPIVSCVASLLAGCGDDAGHGQDNWNANVNLNVNWNAQSGCPGALDPLPPRGAEEVVGTGTPESCTEAALRAAVERLNATTAGGTLSFDCGGPRTITLTERLLVTNDLLVDGGGEVTLSGGRQTRIFELDNYVGFAIQRITLTEGLAEDSGGAILHPWYGTLVAVAVDFVDNHTVSDDHDIGGGAVFAGGLSEAVFSGCSFVGNSASNGGGLLNRGSTLTVIDCLFSQNRARSTGEGQYGNGGGLYIDGMSYDEVGDFFLCGSVFEENQANTHGSALFGYFYEGSEATIDRCLFARNHFDGSPTGGAGGVYHEAVPLTLLASTFADNRSDQHAAGLFLATGATANIVSCTFSGNQVPEVGAALFVGNATASLTSCTIAENDADYGPAIFQGEQAVVRLTSTLFAYNSTPNAYSALACHEPAQDGGGNLQWPDTKNNGNPDPPCVEGITFADPLLGPLQDNGGPTPTRALGDGSPAIDAAIDCPVTDQRGEPRQGACDVGAYEAQP